MLARWMVARWMLACWMLARWMLACWMLGRWMLDFTLVKTIDIISLFCYLLIYLFFCLFKLY